MFPTNESSRELLQEEREQIALVYRALVTGKQKRYLAMRESGWLLFWHPGDATNWASWGITRDGKEVALQHSYYAPQGLVTPEDENLFVDAVVACGGLDFERIWFEEKSEEKSEEKTEEKTA